MKSYVEAHITYAVEHIEKHTQQRTIPSRLHYYPTPGGPSALDYSTLSWGLLLLNSRFRPRYALLYLLGLVGEGVVRGEGIGGVSTCHQVHHLRPSRVLVHPV